MNGAASFAWFRLFSTKGYGPVRITNLIKRAALNGLKVVDIFDLERTEFAKIFAPKGEEIYDNLHTQDLDDISAQYYRLLGEDVEIINPEHNLYPGRLKNLFLDQAPNLLFAKGKLNLIDSPGIAVVGSRDVDEKGLELALECADTAAESGFNVVSGYARGVDTAAHLGAMKSGGTTTMVLGYGLDHFRIKNVLNDYPWENDSLRISQFHPREAWKNSHGMIRNKVIVGLSKAVIVITAGEKSGTINTGNITLKAGIPLLVMAPELFPYPPEGNLKLIENGAVKIDAVEVLKQKLDDIFTGIKDKSDSDHSNKQGMLPL